MTAKRMSAALPFAAAAAIVAAAGLAAGLVAGVSAETSDIAPVIAPYRIDEAPSAGKGAFGLIDNFAWRAFVTLNWFFLPDAAHRGIPDRSKSLGDEGKRVWDTFKSGYELFPIGDGGHQTAPSPWTSHAGRKPSGEIDNREQTIASFEPFADFGQPSFTVGVARQSARRRQQRLYPLSVSNRSNSRLSRRTTGVGRRTCPTRAVRRTFPRARSRSKRRGCR
jgi:hypothetical protein